MKKSFYGFLLGFALLLGASAFQSCKDVSSDLQTEIDNLTNANLIERLKNAEDSIMALRKDVDKAKKTANAVLDSANAALDSAKIVKTALDALEGKLATVDTLAQAALDSADSIRKDLKNYATKLELDTVAKRVDTLEMKIDTLKLRVDTLKLQLDSLVIKVDSLAKELKAIKEQPLGVTVQQVWNPIFGSINLPVGVNTNILLAYKANGSVASGPLAGASAGFSNNGNAGTIYLTVDPTTIDFRGRSVDLVNSQNEKPAAVSLSPLKESNKVLQFGYTRAEGANHLYETEATFNEAMEVEEFKFDVEEVKEALSDKSVSLSNLKKVAKTMAEVVLQNSRSFTAYGVEIEGDSNEVVSKYDVAAVAIRPLTFETIDHVGEVLDGINFDALFSGIRAKVDGINLGDLNLDDPVDVTIPSVNATVTVPIDVEVYDENGVVVGSIDDTLKGSATTNATTTTVEIPLNVDLSAIDALKDVVNAMLDKVVGGLNMVKKFPVLAQPAIFAIDGNEIKILSKDANKPTVLNSGARLFATSYGLETLVPFYKKSLVATGASLSKSGLLEGFEKESVITGSGNATIEYSVIDYNCKYDAATSDANNKYYVVIK